MHGRCLSSASLTASTGARPFWPKKRCSRTTTVQGRRRKRMAKCPLKWWKLIELIYIQKTWNFVIKLEEFIENGHIIHQGRENWPPLIGSKPSALQFHNNFFGFDRSRWIGRSALNGLGQNDGGVHEALVLGSLMFIGKCGFCIIVEHLMDLTEFSDLKIKGRIFIWIKYLIWIKQNDSVI